MRPISSVCDVASLESHHSAKGRDVQRMKEVWTGSQGCGWAFMSYRHSAYSQRQAFESLLSRFSISMFTESTVLPKLNNKASV